MGTVKFEIDIPDFKDELTLEIKIKKDGEVLVDGTSSAQTTSTPKKKVVKKETPPSSNSGGNLMNMDF